MKSMLLILSTMLFALAGHADARERNIMLTNFDGVRVEGPFDVRVTTGGNTGAVISGDNHSVDDVDIRVEAGTLIVSPSVSNWGGWPGAKEARPVITITARTIDDAQVVGGGRLVIDHVEGQQVSLSVAGSGMLAIENADADQLRASLVGSGAMTVAGGAVGQARFVNDGSGRIDAGRLNAKDLTIISSGPGGGEFRASRAADVSALGIGDIHIAGDAACTIKGPGPVRCESGN